MKGLHITSLAGNDINEFEDMLIYWIKKCAKHFSKSVMLFDRNRLVVGETTNMNGNNYLYRVRLNRFFIEYICINGNMCVLSKVVQTDMESEEILYEVPDRWSVSYLWYAY